ncbi:MAG TPA: DNA adenine methylase [Kiritimatiellia bacterium]|jgi:DNA adenine methylase|nr:DNA adenine methylase [Kiritimatiellia bacterium]HOR73493.1 DNA adenine methylase [Kiritimatiellia bacterium]HOU58117.1 DNA adenine methylase [Kiritimatiellia bacterium]HPK68454.1 DNA adenine methylase [Kiritimatiellia bacterium]HPV46178.1 DNA adenine methylase [Kiritimatiellia bacterium]
MRKEAQILLFPELGDELEAPKPINVASIPQRSPFRYPGGKTWFVPTFRSWISSIFPKPQYLVEPFVGGGIISLTALFENLVERAVMVEIDDDIAAVWRAVVNGEADWLARRIMEFDLTKDSVVREISRTPRSSKEKAFQTILKNRTYHGGILAAGSGFLKYGENGKGIKSRWYPATLARRLTNMNLIARRMEFRQEDGLAVIQRHAADQRAAFFIDPPYTAGGKKAGKRLYRHCELDHHRLFSICETIAGEFLMTYDNAEEVKIMARAHGFQMRLIPMTNTHNATMSELVIGKDLAWLDQYPAVGEPKVSYRVKKAANKAKTSARRTRKPEPEQA